MKYRDIVKLFEIEYETAANGKRKPVRRYVGPTYRLAEDARRRACLKLWILWALSAALMLTAGLVPSRCAMANLAAALYMLCLLPLIYLLLGTVRITRMKETINEIDLCDGIRYAQRSGVWLGIVAAGWLVAGGVFLMRSGFGGMWVNDVAFLLCALGCSVCGFAAWRVASALKPEELPRA